MNKEVKEALRVLEKAYTNSVQSKAPKAKSFLQLMKTIGFTENSIFEACPELQYKADKKFNINENRF